MSRSPTAPGECPVCGAEVPQGASACPACGSDDRTGWSEAARLDGLDLPDNSFDYDEFVAREFEGKEPRRRRATLWIWVAVGLALALLSLAAGLWR